MMAVKTILAGGVALAALVAATPASAQFGYGGGGDIIGQVIGGIIGGGGSYGSPYGGGYGSPYGGGYGSPYGGAYGSPYGGGYGSPYGGSYGSPYGGGYGSPYGYGGGGNGQVNQYAVGMCMGAVQQRLDASFARTQYGGARVLGVSDVEARSNGGTLVSGVANSGRGGTYYGSQSGQLPVDLTFTCKTDRSGQVSSIEIGQASVSVDPRIGVPGASPYANDYSEYGYRRY